jgi:hypothetical protein
MAKMNHSSFCSTAANTKQPLLSCPLGSVLSCTGYRVQRAGSVQKRRGSVNNLFNLKTFNELKKDQTNIKIFKNSSFDSSFNSVQSLNTNLSHLIPSPVFSPATPKEGCSVGSCASLNAKSGGRSSSTKNIKNPKFSAILRAIRSIRLNRDEWKLIRYINLMEKKDI